MILDLASLIELLELTATLKAVSTLHSLLELNGARWILFKVSIGDTYI